MKKRLLAVSAALCLALALLPAFVNAAPLTGTCGGDYDTGEGNEATWEVSGLTLTIRGKGMVDDFYIDDKCYEDPEYVDKDLDEILAAIETVVFNSSSITSVEGGVFNDTTRFPNLKEVKINSGVKDIGISAFEGCTSLESVTISSTSVKTIGNSAFKDCTVLNSITLPSSVTTIGDKAFSGCEALSNITIPTGVTYIGDYAFYECMGLGNITIPKNVTYIGSSAFESCDKLASVIFSEGMKLTKNSKDEDGNDLLDDEGKPIPEDVIDSSAFYGCENLNHIKIPKSFEPPEYWDVFADCNKLTSAGPTDDYPITYSWTQIPNNTFAWGTSLEEVNIPSNVTSIGENAFPDGIRVRFAEKRTSLPYWRGDIPSLELYFPATLTSMTKVSTTDSVWNYYDLQIYFAGTKDAWNGMTKVSYGDAFSTDNVIFTVPHTITVEPSENGAITVKPSDKASINERVSITAVPEEGYVLTSLIVQDEDGNTIEEWYPTEEDYSGREKSVTKGEVAQ